MSEGPSVHVSLKAHDYLAEGRVTVVSVDPAKAEVTGSSDEPYEVIWIEPAWTCTCPAQVEWCTHITATALVVDPPAEASGPTTTIADEELDALLDGGL